MITWHVVPDDRLLSGGHAYDGNGNELGVNGARASYDFENHLVQLGTRDYTAYSYDSDGSGNILRAR